MRKTLGANPYRHQREARTVKRTPSDHDYDEGNRLGWIIPPPTSPRQVENEYAGTTFALFFPLVIVAALGLLALTGCNITSLPPADTNGARAYVAVTMAFTQPGARRPSPVRTTCDKCDGTKRVKSGDGLAMVACECGENCKCVETGDPPGDTDIATSLVMITSDNCPPCLRWKKEIAPWLKASGWIIGTGEGNHLQYSGGTGYEYEVLPTFIRLKDGKEVARHEGYADKDDIRRLLGNAQRVSSGSKFTSGSNYPVRSAWWTFPGNTREDMIEHLQEGFHAGKFSEQWLETLTWPELNSLHSDDHEGKVRWPTNRKKTTTRRTVIRSGSG